VIGVELNRDAVKDAVINAKPLNPLLISPKNIKPIMNGGIAMSNYKDYKKKVLQNPEIKSEYDALQPEYDIIQAMIDARLQQNLTQKDLSARTGITQADISRIENGTRNPSLSMVKKLAHGLGL
jgi:ribosome-binding protein aMBF1 (putative translation factor)